jgi:hypothetical protein
LKLQYSTPCTWSALFSMHLQLNLSCIYETCYWTTTTTPFELPSSTISANNAFSHHSWGHKSYTST